MRAWARNPLGEERITQMIYIILSLIVFGLIHSTLASLWFKGLAARVVGQAAYRRWYRLFFNLVAALTVLPILALLLLLPSPVIYTIPSPWVLLTMMIQLLAAVGLLQTVYLTGADNFLGVEQALDPVAAARPRKMTTKGLYRFVRHPLYTTSFVFVWLMPVMTWNLLAFNIALTVYTTIGAFFEERKLLLEFGEPYARYREHTPMLVPIKLEPGRREDTKV